MALKLKWTKKVKLVEEDYPLVKPRIKEKKISTVRIVEHGDHDYGVVGDVVVVLLKGKKYVRTIRWEDLGHYEGYPYVIINGIEYGLEED